MHCGVTSTTDHPRTDSVGDDATSDGAIGAVDGGDHWALNHRCRSLGGEIDLKLTRWGDNHSAGGDDDVHSKTPTAVATTKLAHHYHQ